MVIHFMPIFIQFPFYLHGHNKKRRKHFQIFIKLKIKFSKHIQKMIGKNDWAKMIIEVFLQCF